MKKRFVILAVTAAMLLTLFSACGSSGSLSSSPSFTPDWMTNPAIEKPTVPETPNVYGGGGLVAIQGDWIFYINTSDGSTLYAIKTDGTNRQKLCDVATFCINVVGDRIYYQNSGGAQLYSVKIDGTDRQTLIGIGNKAYCINVVGDRIYVTSGRNGDKIYSMNTDGSDKQKLSNDRAWDINVVGDRIFYINQSGGDKIYSMNLDGSGKQKLNDERSSNLNVAGGRIYYLSDIGLYAMNTDGSNRQKLLDRRVTSSMAGIGRIGYKIAGVTSFKATVDCIYYINAGDGSKIYSMSIDGIYNAKLNNDDANVIDVVGDRIYYMRRFAREIYSMKTDGTDKQVLD